MLSLVVSIISFIFAITILVTVHEFGHFWVARRFNVKVLRFSIGFGKPLWKHMSKRGTEFVISARWLRQNAR
jgi:regulator of sigma E protease